MIERNVVEEVRRRTDLAELIGQYVPLRKTGANWVARCPFHEERTPSFNVRSDAGGGFFFCFGCKASGDAFRFLEKIDGIGFREALEQLAAKAGVELPETRDPERIAEEKRQRDLGDRLAGVCEAAAQFFERALHEAPYSELARGALDERAISPEVAQRFRLGFAPARWDALAEHFRAQRISPADAELAGLLLPGKNGGWYDRFRHRLMFPIVDIAGRVVAFSGRVLPVTEDMQEGIVPPDAGKYVNSPETPIYKKSDLLYGLGVAKSEIRRKAEAILVEGNFDVVQMHHFGFGDTVAPLGTSFTEAQARLLRRLAERVVIVFDGDEAGRKAARAAHAVCAKAKLVARVGVLPQKSDPDSYLRSDDPARGLAGMTAVLSGAPSVVEWLIRDAALGAGDNAPERVAAARALAPVIAAVIDPIEQGVYVRQAAAALFLSESDVARAIREHLAQAANAGRASPFPSGPSAPRVGLSGHADPAKRAMADGFEVLLFHPALFDDHDTEEFIALSDDAIRPVLKLARAQWIDHRELLAAQLLDAAQTDALRRWMTERLIPRAVDDETAKRYAATLAQSAGTLRRLRIEDAARALKSESARAGMQGDPGTEERALNEQLGIKRNLALAKAGGKKTGET